MSKLPIITPKKLIKILEKLDFKLDHSTGSHFVFYNYKSKKRTIIPYHLKDLPKGTLMSILKEIGLDKEEFKVILKKI